MAPALVNVLISCIAWCKQVQSDGKDQGTRALNAKHRKGVADISNSGAETELRRIGGLQKLRCQCRIRLEHPVKIVNRRITFGRHLQKFESNGIEGRKMAQLTQRRRALLVKTGVRVLVYAGYGATPREQIS